jgi:conjugative relaxase-like TrwC/TraI family protein
MLTVGAMGAGSSAYYTGLSKEDYYTKGQEPPGAWLGTGAEKIGLSGVVKPQELKNVFCGFSPDGTEKLVQNAGKMTGKLSRDPGWDLTFSAPKSVSICWAISEPEVQRIFERAHLEAIKTVVSDIEAQTVIRKGKGGYIREQAGLVVATYQHSTSRAINKNTLPDMELHTHCLVMNLGVSPTDGKTRAIKSNVLYENQKEWGAAYRAELAKNLTALGFLCEKTENAFELKGVSPEVIKEFSKRTEQVRAQTEGITDKREVEKVKLRGRVVKEDHSRENLFSYWQSRAAELGLSARSVLELTETPRPYERSVEIEKGRAVEAAVKKLTEEKPVFTKDELQRAIAHEATGSGLGFREVIAATKDFLQREAIPLGTKDGGVVFTTDATAEKETKKLIEREKAAEKEKAALLGDYRKELEKEGLKVLGCTFSKAKAKELEEATGLKSRTIKKALYELEGKDPSRYYREIQRSQHGRTIRTKEEKEKQQTVREIYAIYKYATRQWSKDSMKEYTGHKHRPSSERVHEFKYATHQISKAQRDFLNRELEKERNKIDKKTVVVIDARPSRRGDLKKLVDEIERKGGRVIFAEDATQEQQQKRQIAELTRRQEQEKQKEPQEQAIGYNR